jgi:hypothetical protein
MVTRAIGVDEVQREYAVCKKHNTDCGHLPSNSVLVLILNSVFGGIKG